VSRWNGTGPALIRKPPLTTEQLEQIACQQRSGAYGEQNELVGELLRYIRQTEEALRWSASRRDITVTTKRGRCDDCRKGDHCGGCECCDVPPERR
jgi:hypothetical protein